MDATPPPEPAAEPRSVRLLRGLLAGWTVVMLGLSRPLWTGHPDVPRVPFAVGLPQATGAAGWVGFAALVAAVALAGVARVWRPWFAASVVLFGYLILGDQHRFQPWAYQYAMTGLMLAGLPPGRRLTYSRLWYVSIYVHSGLSKLDASFADELGTLFLATALRPLGVDPLGWSPAARGAAVMVMPVGEILAGAALVWPGSRRWGLAGVTVLHLTLLGVLGPAGLGHSTIVLAWNGAMLTQVWAAFWPALDGTVGAAPRWRTYAATPVGLVVKLAFLAGVALPLGERWGLCDPWPAHALYASHVERLTVDLHESEVAGYPASVRAKLSEVGAGPWRRLNLTDWSRSVRGTPVYPGNRAGLGLAEGLVARYGERGLVRLTLFGAADRWTGRRSRTELLGLDEVRRRGDAFRLNAHPARGGTPGAAGRRPPAGQVRPDGGDGDAPAVTPGHDGGRNGVGPAGRRTG